MADHQKSTVLLSQNGGRNPRIHEEDLSERDLEAAQQLMHLSDSDNYAAATATTTSSTASIGCNKNTDTENRKNEKKKRAMVVDEDCRSARITLNKMKGGTSRKVDHQKYRTLVDLYSATRPIEDDQLR